MSTRKPSRTVTFVRDPELGEVRIRKSSVVAVEVGWKDDWGLTYTRIHLTGGQCFWVSQGDAKKAYAMLEDEA